MAEHNELGKKGEEIAVGFLRTNGFIILETNWRFGNKEVDIIARKDKLLVVAEVKTRSGNYMGDPEVFVTREKQKFIIRAANAYVTKKNLDVEVRFDIISIIVNGPGHTIKHIEDAFYPTL
ncbi:MAG: YraN family protein [Bacteroidetes bacterium]|nr:YraN family protein [Bacteroidota bacterium]